MDYFIFEIRNMTKYEMKLFIEALKEDQDKKEFFELFKKYYVKTNYSSGKNLFKTERKEHRVANYKIARLLNIIKTINIDNIREAFYVGETK